MNKLLGTALLTATLCAGAGAALADEMAHEARSVTAGVTKVRLGGVIDLHVRQGATASLVVWGDDAADLSKVTTTQAGDTLQIDTERHGFQWGRERRHLRADLTVPNLAEFVSQGVGSSDVSGFAGESIRISLDGAGAVRLDGGYRNIDARLGGVGGLTMNGVDAERIELSLRGAGRITVQGKTRLLRARLGGVGSLQAQDLRADTVDLTGIGGAKVYAANAANVALSGLGSAAVYGNPARRNATSSGLGRVSWR